MIRMLYEVQQKEDEMVEEYMVSIHNMVTVIHHAWPQWPQCVLSSGDELLSEGRVEMLCVWVTWPFC